MTLQINAECVENLDGTSHIPKDVVEGSDDDTTNKWHVRGEFGRSFPYFLRS